MRTHFKNLATAVVLYTVVLAKSCSKKSIVVSPTDDKGGSTKLIQHRFASPAKALQDDNSILDDDTAMETADNYSEEEQQDDPGAGLQGNNNLSPRRKRNNRGSYVPSNSINKPNSGQGSKQSLLELMNKLKEIEQLKQDENAIANNFTKDIRKIKRNLDLIKSSAYEVRGSLTQKGIQKDIEELEKKVQVRKTQLNSVIRRGTEIFDEVTVLQTQMKQSTESEKKKAIEIHNKVQDHRKTLNDCAGQYFGLERQLRSLG
ncbi:MAG: hypothetical protein NQ127_02470 [Candidatus Cardinium sp.]|nr:hypothetical protein [Candidatus Cardinium sp.]